MNGNFSSPAQSGEHSCGGMQGWECIQSSRLGRMACLLVAMLGFSSCMHLAPCTGPVLCPRGASVWRASDGCRLMYRSWNVANARPRAVVIAVPGWDGTACDIEPLARYLGTRRIQVYSMSVRGQHGDLSARVHHTVGESDDWRNWPNDLRGFAKSVERRHPETPVILYGQSMGSMTALIVASESSKLRPVRGIILHSPAVAMIYPSPLLPLFVKTERLFNANGRMSDVTMMPKDKPALTNNLELDTRWRTSRDRVCEGFTWRFVDESLKLGVRARDAAAILEQPAVLVLTGDKDRIGPALIGQNGFAHLMRNIPAAKKERYRFPNGYHDLLHDSNAASAERCIGHWLDRVLSEKTGI